MSGVVSDVIDVAKSAVDVISGNWFGIPGDIANVGADVGLWNKGPITEGLSALGGIGSALGGNQGLDKIFGGATTGTAATSAPGTGAGSVNLGGGPTGPLGPGVTVPGIGGATTSASSAPDLFNGTSLASGGDPLGALTGGASAATGGAQLASGVGSAAQAGSNLASGGGIGGFLSRNAGWISPALGVAGMVASKPNLSTATQGQQGIASTLVGIGTPLASSLSTGQLPAGLQAGVTNWQKGAEAAVKSRYAALGLSGSTMETQDLNNLAQQGTAYEGQLLQAITNTGLSALGMASSTYGQVANAQIQQDQALQQALTNFASSIGKNLGVGSVQSPTVPAGAK